VNLTENPIFLTQKRLTYRAGVLAAVLFAALVGLSLLSGLIAYLADRSNFGFPSPQEAGIMFYGWTMGLEILVLVLGGFSRIARVLAEDRKAGLWDSNRLTPMKPAEIVAGYWFGSTLREFYMGAVLAGTGLMITVLAQLPVTLWLGTQILILSTTLFLGLLALLMGMALQQPQNSVGLLLPLFLFPMFAFALSKYTLINFLLPIYSVVNLFQDSPRTADLNAYSDWSGWPEIFTLPLPPVGLSLGLQLAVGFFLWRATVRKTANPFQPLLPHWEAVATFALLVVVQHGMVWGLWRGHFKMPLYNHSDYAYGGTPLLPIIHGGTLLVGAVILALASPLPERVRVAALRIGQGNLRLVFSRSAVAPALALAAVAGIASLTQVIFSIQNQGVAWMLATANLLLFFLMFVLLLEFCRLRFQRRALGFVALWLFVLCVLPFILAGVFSSEALAKLSFLTPGVVALAGPDNGELKYLAGCTMIHCFVVVLLLYAWHQQWKRLLATPSPAPPAH
jgi:hypothetical protein